MREKTKVHQVDEGVIKLALEQGYITSKEADEMQRVYIHKLIPSSHPQNKRKQLS